MSFMPGKFSGVETPRLVGAIGPKDAKIAFVGEAPAAEELRQGIPFVGPAGQIFENCLHAAGIVRSQVYITNLIKHKIPYNGVDAYVNPNTNRLTAVGIKCRDQLAEEMKDVSANIVVPLGNAANVAISGNTMKISHARGYMGVACSHFAGRKYLPTFHPSSVQYGGSYLNNYPIIKDFEKALANADTPDHQYQEVEIIIPKSSDEAKEILHFLRGKSPLSFDIEVLNYEVSCIGFSTMDTIAYSIPFLNSWTDDTETEIWELIAELLEDPNTAKIIQNSIFDVHFLATRNRIFVKGPIYDTMIAHSIVYPDLLKGLEFLGSIYCNLPHWKNMIDFNNIKKES